MGWRLREDAWGQGYAKEAAIASLDLAFDRFGASHVVALTIPANEPSQGLMKRLGMTRREDMDFESADVPEGMGPVVVYRIEADEWPSARAAVSLRSPRRRGALLSHQCVRTGGGRSR